MSRRGATGRGEGRGEGALARHAERGLRGLLLLVAIFIGVGVFPLDWAEVEDTSAVAALTRWRWLPSRVLAGILGLLALIAGLAALALLVRIPWLLLRPPWGRPGDHPCFDHDALAFRPAHHRVVALLAEGKLLLVAAGITAALAGLAYWYGRTDRVALDLAERRYERRTDYLGLVTLRAQERPLSEVRGVRTELRSHEDDDGDVSYTYYLVVELSEPDEVWLETNPLPRDLAAAAFQRLLAARGRRELTEAGPR